MRLALRIDLIRRRTPYFAICTALAFSAPMAQAAPAQSAKRMNSSDSASVPVKDDSQIAASANRAADAAAMNDFSRDDQMLSRQHGGEVGMLMVAAVPELTQDDRNQVTLWDEIAPPSPLPVPLDAARAAQGNVAT